MRSRLPSWLEVREDLGEKVLAAFWNAVEAVRLDLAIYRRDHPGWVAEHSKSGLAHWIQDRLWAQLTAHLTNCRAW